MPYRNKFAPPEFIKLLHRTREMRDFSDMSISQLWQHAKAEEFFERGDEADVNNETVRAGEQELPVADPKGPDSVQTGAVRGL